METNVTRVREVVNYLGRCTELQDVDDRSCCLTKDDIRLLLEAINLSIPVKPIVDDEYNCKYVTRFLCPSCMGEFVGIGVNNCYHCGQKFTWV